jgi:hypothetical protein
VSFVPAADPHPCSHASLSSINQCSRSLSKNRSIARCRLDFRLTFKVLTLQPYEDDTFRLSPSHPQHDSALHHPLPLRRPGTRVNPPLCFLSVRFSCWQAKHAYLHFLSHKVPSIARDLRIRPIRLLGCALTSSICLRLYNKMPHPKHSSGSHIQPAKSNGISRAGTASSDSTEKSSTKLHKRSRSGELEAIHSLRRLLSARRNQLA